MVKMVTMGLVLLAVLFVAGAAGAADSVADKCADKFQKVAVCLSFASGKADTPTKECCTSVKGIKESQPECLCYIIQQTNSASGSPEIKKMGIQVAKLLQLPSACNLVNASASNCPALLGLAPNSPDALIFSNNGTTTATNSTPTATPGQSSPDTASSGVTKLGTGYAGMLVAVAVSVFFVTFPAVGFADLYN